MTRGIGSRWWLALLTPLLAVAGAAGGCDSGGSTSPSRTFATVTSDTSAGLDACRVVTTKMVSADLGLPLSGPGASSPSFFGRRGVTDCAWFEGAVSVTVHATTVATQDLGDGTIQGFLDAGGQAVPDADRGVALATSDTAGSAVTLIVVRGERAVEVAAAGDTAISQDQALRLGSDIASTLS